MKELEPAGKACGFLRARASKGLRAGGVQFWTRRSDFKDLSVQICPLCDCQARRETGP
jgi:hypothetical protein